MEKVRVTSLMDLDFYNKLCKSAKERGMTVSGYIRFSVSELQRKENAQVNQGFMES